MTLINTLNLSRSNANWVIAASLASGAIQAVQSREFADLETLVGATPSSGD